MNFVKERNFIVAYDGENKMGIWDITTGNFIGKKGKPIKSVPSCFTFDNLPYDTFDRNGTLLLGHTIRRYRDWFNNYYDNDAYTKARASRYESMISLGIMPANTCDLDSTIPLTKDVVKFCKDERKGYYNDDYVKLYVAQKKYASFYEGKPEWVKSVFLANCDTMPIDYLQKMINRIILEHADDLFGGYTKVNHLSTLIKGYYNKSMELYGKVEVPHNVLTHFAMLNYLYNEHKLEHYDENLKANNAKPWLYYENENYIVRPLLTRKEFHEEAEAQGNCVERLYMEKVCNGTTHVVSIRRKIEPEKSYITCEVDNIGNIVQYLLRFNQRPTSEEDKKFKLEYQFYLMENTLEEE